VRKELGRPTRELFFKLLRETAPEFRPSSKYQIKGFTWQFMREYPDLRQWIWFQRHKYEVAFTVELSWSQVVDAPTGPPFGSPGIRLAKRVSLGSAHSGALVGTTGDMLRINHRRSELVRAACQASHRR
jgi:hypothetical protein